LVFPITVIRADPLASDNYLKARFLRYFALFFVVFRSFSTHFDLPQPFFASVLFVVSPFFPISRDVGDVGYHSIPRPPLPTPYVDPFPPKVTQCHPRLRVQAEGRNPKKQTSGLKRPDVKKQKPLWPAGALACDLQTKHEN
jgi:hypothetical protein